MATDEDDGIDALIAGHRRFRERDWPAEGARYAKLGNEGQAPAVMVISCCDSRVTPEAIFDAGPGELFVVRNVANLAPPFETLGAYHGVSAALEFALMSLEVRTILVLGHAGCGGVRAALADRFGPNSPHGFVKNWMSLLDPARAEVRARGLGDVEAEAHALEIEGLKLSLANLRSFPFVAEREAAGRLSLQAAWFDIAEGALHLLDEETGALARLD